MKLTKSKLKQIIREELTKVVEEYDPVLGYDVAPEPEPETVQLSDREKAILKNRYIDYVGDHKKTQEMVKRGIIDKEADEAQPRSAQQFINYLMADPDSRQVDLSDLAQRGLDEEGFDFFNNLGIPLKR